MISSAGCGSGVVSFTEGTSEIAGGLKTRRRARARVGADDGNCSMAVTNRVC
jgi:hypothetical protein